MGQLDFKSLLEIITKEHQDANVFIDELPITDISDIKSLKNLATVCHDKTLWVTITGVPKKELYDLLIEEVRNVFEIPDLLLPLRNATSIVKYAYPEFSMFLKVKK